jgi:hypothetical protein
VVHADNARPHVSLQKSQTIPRGQRTEKGTTSALLPRLLQGTEFQTVEELLDVVVRILAGIPLEALMATFHEWLQRLQAYINGDGEYVE